MGSLMLRSHHLAVWQYTQKKLVKSIAELWTLLVFFSPCILPYCQMMRSQHQTTHFHRLYWTLTASNRRTWWWPLNRPKHVVLLTLWLINTSCVWHPYLHLLQLLIHKIRPTNPWNTDHITSTTQWRKIGHGRDDATEQVTHLHVQLQY